MLCAFSPLPAEGGRPDFFYTSFHFSFFRFAALKFPSLTLLFFFDSADGNSLIRKQAFTFCSEGILARQSVLHS